jgi:hypothetical protein
MEDTVRTIYGGYLQTCQLLGIPFELKPFTTLNEKFLASENVPLTALDMPRNRYLVIGNGGHKLKTSGNSTLQVPEPLQHRTTDPALFNHVPFVLRPQTNDLTETERERYGLRVAETHDNEEYFAYYARRLDLDTVAAEMNIRHVVNGVVTSEEFVPTIDNLNPIPPAVPVGGSVPTTGDYAVASARVNFTLDAFDIAEIKNAALILEGSEDFAIISEFGLVSGVDKVVPALDAMGTSFNFNEIIGAQIVTFRTAFHVLKSTSNGINTVFEVGATEPLWLLP